MRSWLLLLVCIILFIECSSRRSDSPPDSATSGRFELVADETLRPVIDSLVAGFNYQTPNATVTVRYTNATTALDDLLQSRTRLVLIGRPLAKSETDLIAKSGIELTDADVAVNAIGCLVNSKNTLESISLDQLRQIVGDRSISNANREGLLRISSSYLSSTEFAVDSIFGLTKYQEGEIRFFETTDSIIKRIRNDEHAIGFVGVSWLKNILQSSDSSVRVLPISGIVEKPIILHPAYLLQGIYPLTSRVMGYTSAVPNTLPRGFLAYCMSADGQRVFLNYGLLPKTQILKLVASPEESR
ncbi:MAG: substrate-binding domain-containing protein [Ignavibacteriota bacterium]